jgi:hypothetical protein
MAGGQLDFNQVAANPMQRWPHSLPLGDPYFGAREWRGSAQLVLARFNYSSES